MTKAEQIADRLLALINSSPRTPTREQMVEEIKQILNAGDVWSAFVAAVVRSDPPLLVVRDGRTWIDFELDEPGRMEVVLPEKQ